MLTSRRVILAAVVPALAVPLGCGDSVKVALAYHPPAGATYQYTLEQQTDMTFEGGPMGKMPKQQMAMHVYFNQMVTGPTTGGIGVTVRIDSTTLDSPLMAANAYRPAFDRLRGLTSNVVYDDHMNVVRAEFANAGGSTSPITDQIAKNLKEATFPLPPGPVGVGDSWTVEMDLPVNQMATGGGPPFKATTKLTLKEIHADGPDTTVLVALETTFPKDPITVQQQGQTLTLKLSGSLTGEQLFSVKRGAVVRSSRSGTMQVNMTGGMLGTEGTNLTAKQLISLQLHEAK